MSGKCGAKVTEGRNECKIFALFAVRKRFARCFKGASPWVRFNAVCRLLLRLQCCAGFGDTPPLGVVLFVKGQFVCT